MDNKNLFFAFIFAFTFTLFVVSCNERSSKHIDKAYTVVDSKQDSVLVILNNINKEKVSSKELGKYALFYTIVLDKKGFDVDVDSLLRIAYTYCNDKYQDSSYAKCQYYMGKYYVLKDNSEKAKVCFEKSIEATKKIGDKNTLCLALEQMSKIDRNTNPQKAISEAKEAFNIYISMKNATKANKIYFKLNISESLIFANKLDFAHKECFEAIDWANQLGDSSIISDVCQDMALILRMKGDFFNGLAFAKQSYKFGRKADLSKTLNLAWAYLDADSLMKCSQALNNFKSDDISYIYMMYYVKHILAIKNRDFEEAKKCADSSYTCIENMYANQLALKENYYSILVNSQYEKEKTERMVNMQNWLIALLVLIAIVIIFFILHSYKSYKEKAKLERSKENKKRILEKDKYEEELKQNEIYISNLRSYIFEKIEIAQKIDYIRVNTIKPVLLSTEEWNEIRAFVDIIEGDFVTRLQQVFPNLTIKDIDFMILLRLKMPAKAMALIYSISEKSIRQKLFVYKTKVGIDGNKNSSLRAFIEKF